MRDGLAVGVSRFLIKVPAALWRRRIAGQARRAEASLRFMSSDHHRVRDFAVRELPRLGSTLSPELIARELDLPTNRVQAVLDELERRLMFLFRDAAGAVAWAYPVTAEETPHRVTFSTGERGFAA